MPAARRNSIPADSLLQLRQRLATLPPKSAERAVQIRAVATLYGLSPATVYRALRGFGKPSPAHRADFGRPRILARSQMERYCELIAALKLRTTNRNGRHLSTQRAIELLEEFGVETREGFVQAPRGVLTRPTVNRYLALWHLDHARLTRERAAVRFQAVSAAAGFRVNLAASVRQ